MPIQVTCTCGSRITVRDEAAGRGIECPRCGATVQIPETEERVPCPHCSAPILPVARICPSCRSALPVGASKTCVNCGHANALGAKACSKCCETLPAVRAAPPPRPSRPEEAMLVVDWILGIVFPCIGVLLGIVYLCTGKPTRGWKTLLLSLIALLFWFVLSGMLA